MVVERMKEGIAGSWVKVLLYWLGVCKVEFGPSQVPVRGPAIHAPRGTVHLGDLDEVAPK